MIFRHRNSNFGRSREIDAAGVQRVTGKTFRWSGEYAWDMNTRETRSVDAECLRAFPSGPAGCAYKQTDFVLLANIAPALQSHVLDQMEKPRFVVADTMDLWIETARADLDALLPRVDLLILNDSEAREMTKETSLIKAGRAIRKAGPKLSSRSRKASMARSFSARTNFFSCGAYPLEDIHDPTGAGDTFAGGMAGYLASSERRVGFCDLPAGGDLRQRARQLQRGSVQHGPAADAAAGGNLPALRNVLRHEPVRSALRQVRASVRFQPLVRRLAGALAVCLLVAGGPLQAHGPWVVLNECRLLPNESNDGDSFHVSAMGKEYIFRLYLVDAPETDACFPARVDEQAKYFNLSRADRATGRFREVRRGKTGAAFYRPHLQAGRAWGGADGALTTPSSKRAKAIWASCWWPMDGPGARRRRRRIGLILRNCEGRSCSDSKAKPSGPGWAAGARASVA